MHKDTKKSAGTKNKPGPWGRLLASIWLFPLLLTAALFILTACKISGSSLGIYQTLFYGHSQKDPALLFNKPREIRSDEWVVNTQMVIAQKNNDFKRINQNIGHGQDMSVVIDAPYREWSQVFRLQNWAFFVLPLEQAFAFKWWLLAYLLMLSCYFLVLALLPGRRLLAAALATGLFFGGMIQWWYQTITLAPVYYCLFMATVIIYLTRAKKLASGFGWSALLAYLAASFALVLYPPFQIACAIGLGAFATGYLIHALRKAQRRQILKTLGLLGAAAVVAGFIVLLFTHTRSGAIHAIENTAYPGKRVVASGGFDVGHTFSGHLGFQEQFTSKAKEYRTGHGELLNQSEASNFILLLPFLFLPSLYILYRDRKRAKPADWPLITVTLGFLCMLAWLFVPHLDPIGKLVLLDKVQLIRLLLGLGLLNLIQFVLVARRMPEVKGDRVFKTPYVLTYAVIIFAIEVWLGKLAMDRSPGFITIHYVLALAVPVPVIVYAFLRGRTTLAAIGLLVFSAVSTIGVNPLYRGTALLTQTPLSQAIKQTAAHYSGAWATEISYLENFPAMNGAPSLSGVYAYPQLDLWRSAGQAPDETIYNRYAHVNFVFNRDPDVTVPTQLHLVGGDHFDVTTEPCGDYVHLQHIRFILTTADLTDGCLTLVKAVPYPAAAYHIYKIN